jgi:hypothetical protein
MKEVGAFDPVWISHSKMENVVFEEDSIAISAVIKSKSGIADASIFWTTDTSLGFTSASMDFVSEDSAIAYIPPQIDSTIIYYYVSATSNNGKTIRKPIVAPEGFYKFLVENSVTEVVDIIQPEEFILQQNYPNPFNPNTVISYQLPVSSFVTLKVYDILGNEIVTLVNEELASGNYKVEFNADRISSGIYFYTLNAGSPSTGSGQGFIETRKMILLK